MVETVDVRFDETNGSQRDHLPNVLDEVPSTESIKLMGTGEIIPSESQPEDNPSNDDNDQQEQYNRHKMDILQQAR